LATVQEDRDKLAEQATAQRDHYVKQNRALKADLSHLRSALDECESENETLLAQQMVKQKIKKRTNDRFCTGYRGGIAGGA